MRMNQYRIGTRQALAFGSVIGLMAAIVGLAVTGLQSVSRETDGLLERQRRAGLADEWRGQTELNVTRALAIARSGGASGVSDAFTASMKLTSARIDAVQGQLVAEIQTASGKAALAEIAAARGVYLAARKEVLAQIQSGRIEAAQLLIDARMMPASQTYIAAILALARHEQALVSESGQRLRDQVRLTQQASLLLLLASASLSAFLGWRITRSITAPLRRTVEVTQAIAGGDLTQVIVSEGRDEAAQMLASLASSQAALQRLIGEVRAGSESMTTASNEIAGGNQDLSARTEESASNLQQLASSLEELSSTVSQTADSARVANQLAGSASQIAQRGGQVVAEVVATMGEINTRSRRIADIIGTIDGIAFQTNILALNAAVEAARAGEHGRGFAVVASEVRSLAGRSAEAAREIRLLIGASVEKVESGSRLVADAGSTMGEIVASVQRVSDLIGEISAAAAEQSAGLGQVHGAITELDRMTQQNAALVEQSAAAAESLEDQASQLNRLVGTFKLSALPSAC